MDLSLQPVRLASRHDDEGRLVFADGRLVALLVQLSALHEETAGWWFLELGFGAVDHGAHLSFPDLPAALVWIEARVTTGTPWD